VTLATGAVDRIGDPGARLSVRKGAGAEVEHSVDVLDGRAAIDAALAALDGNELPSPEAVGHRVVHGGPLHRAPERVDARLLGALKALVPFALALRPRSRRSRPSHTGS
jgi:acetate kinase